MWGGDTLLACWHCTPQHLEDLAIGWLIGEGRFDFAASPSDVSIDHDGGAVRVAHSSVLANPVPRPVRPRGKSPAIDGDWRARFGEMFERAEWRERTGGMHTGALVVAGAVRLVREDVSRHRVIDKLIGAGRRAGLPPDESVVLISGRISGTMAARIAQGGIPLAATMSIPTTMAAAIAAEAGLTLVGRARSANPHVYEPEV